MADIARLRATPSAERSCIVLSAYGRRVALDGPPEALELARSRLPPSYRAVGIDLATDREWRIRRSPEGRWLATVGDPPATEALGAPADELAPAVDSLLSDLELWVAEHAVGRVFLHAGCVEADGCAIVLPGRTWSGKSSLTAALVRAGCGYYSDEYAVLDRRGRVHPYPRPLSLRSRGGGPPARCSAADLGGVAGSAPLPVGLVALLRHERQRGWDVEQLSPAGAALALTEHAVAGRRRPAAVLEALAAIAVAPALRGSRGEAEEAAQRLLALVRQAPSSLGVVPAERGLPEAGRRRADIEAPVGRPPRARPRRA